MYKKITAFLLIFILLFNFIAIEKVKAEPITLGTGFLVFAALLTTFGVTLASVSDMEVLYGKFQKDLGQSFQAFKLSAGMIYESVLRLGRNFQIDWEDSNLTKFVDWIKSNFSEGYNSINEYGEDFIYEFEDRNNKTVHFGTILFNSIYANSGGYSLRITQDFSNHTTTFHYSDGFTITEPGTNPGFASWIKFYFYADRVSIHGYTGRTQHLHTIYFNDYNYHDVKPKPINTINYIGADVLTNPTYKPENVPFPPPPINLPGIQDIENGRTYTGTPGQLVQELEDNPEAVREMAGKYIGQNPASVGGIGSVPTYNETSGTITFPNTTVSNPAWDLPVSVDSPWDFPIEVPADVPVPNDIPYGLGVIGWLLHYIAQGMTGIWNFLTNLFSAPTKTLNFDSLMNLDVKEKFPFCLPWDLYNSVATISASPQIPIFEAELKNVPIKIDFTQFEELAKIVRWATTLIYSISLVMISRRLIGGE